MKHISHSVYKIVKAVSLTAHGLGLWAIAVCGIAVSVCGGCVWGGCVDVHYRRSMRCSMVLALLVYTALIKAIVAQLCVLSEA